MSDKRKQNRIQGGWAAAAPRGKTHGSGSLSVKSQVNCTTSDRRLVRPASASSNAPGWLGKTVDQPNIEKKFVYQQPNENHREKPQEKVISTPGIYDLSTEPNGPSRIRLFPTFFTANDADLIFHQLDHELPWRQKEEVIRGQTVCQPRLTAWFGDLPYSYSGMTQKANINWPDILQTIKSRLNDTTGSTFNSMLGNLYRDGHDSVDWHSDDETSLGNKPTIASLSFGDTRNFEMRKKPPKEENSDYTYMEHFKIPLTHGSLLIMEGATQHDWQHRIPKEYHDRGVRINLTFRNIYPSNNTVQVSE